MADLAHGTARSQGLLDELNSILSEEVASPEPEALDEAAKRAMKSAKGAKDKGKGATKAKSSGKELEKKAREKRRAKPGKEGGGGGGGGAGKRNPFKTKKALGPGPRGGTNHETKKWKCSCNTPFKCKCKNRATGRNKIITLHKDYKDDYNKQYKPWRRRQKF